MLERQFKSIKRSIYQFSQWVIVQNWLTISVLAIVAYVLIQAGFILSTPNGLARMQGQDLGLQYWDTANYVGLAHRFQVSPFYPLWPWMIQAIAGVTGMDSYHIAIGTSELIFLASFPLCLWVFIELIQDKPIAVGCFLLYVLGPNAIFGGIGYTEAIFALLSLLFLLCLSRYLKSWNNIYLYFIGPLVILMNLARPALIQTIFSLVVSLSVMIGLSKAGKLDMGGNLRKFFPLVIIISIAAIVGYSIYGWTCVSMGDSFFAPFHAQTTWGRKLQLRPLLLLLPRSLLIDLHSLYLPAAIWAVYVALIGYEFKSQDKKLYFPIPQGWGMIALIHPMISVFLHRKFKLVEIQGRIIDSPAFSLVGLYCFCFSAVHSLINFLANSGYLYSASRHYFGTPYAFVSIAYISLLFERRKLIRVFGAVLIAGVLLLGEQWHNYTKGSWLG